MQVASDANIGDTINERARAPRKQDFNQRPCVTVEAADLRCPRYMRDAVMVGRKRVAAVGGIQVTNILNGQDGWTDDRKQKSREGNVP
jgi:hypothetical protein